MRFRQLDASARAILAGVLITLIALIDWRVDLNIAFGFLYLFPVILVGTALPRRGVLLTAVVCTLLSDFFDPFPFSLNASLPQAILVFAALAGAGLFAHEVTRRGLREAQDRLRLEREIAARREAEEQLAFLVESSPAAILTVAADSRILRANPAAHRLLGVAFGRLAGQSIASYLPALGRISPAGEQVFRTEMQCRGTRAGGEVFLANVFFSTYQTAMGPRLAALIMDASEELREREESTLEQILAGSRIAVGAVAHEIRNVCGAIMVVCENLARAGTLAEDKDFTALGSLVQALDRIASLELSPAAQPGPVDLNETLDDLRIVIEPYCQDADIALAWEVPRDLPPVRADRNHLLQILLNLVRNSRRALEDAAEKTIRIRAAATPGSVSIRVSDTGPGIPAGTRLFQPFQEGAASTGLGLYLSRAFARSSGGEIRHDPSATGCSFVIELAVAAEADAARNVAHGTHTTVTGG